MRVLAGLLSPLKFGWKVPSFVLLVSSWLKQSGLMKAVGIYYYLGKPFCVGQMGGIVSLVIHMNWTLYGSVTWMIGYLGSKILRAGAGMKEGMEKEPHPALTQVYLHLMFLVGRGDCLLSLGQNLEGEPVCDSVYSCTQFCWSCGSLQHWMGGSRFWRTGH